MNLVRYYYFQAKDLAKRLGGHLKIFRRGEKKEMECWLCERDVMATVTTFNVIFSDGSVLSDLLAFRCQKCQILIKVPIYPGTSATERGRLLLKL